MKKKNKKKKEIETILISLKRTFFLTKRRYSRIYIFNEKHKKEIIKQLSEKLEKDIFQNRKKLPQKEFCTKLDFILLQNKKCGKGCFSKAFFEKKKKKRIFPRSSRNSNFFTW